MENGIKIGFRNPIEFINQWEWFKLRFKIRAIVIWLFYVWKTDSLPLPYLWRVYGIRILGIEITWVIYS